MGWFTRKEKLPPSFEARWNDPESAHYISIQGRFAPDVVERELTVRFNNMYPEQAHWVYQGCKKIKPATKRKKV